MFRQLPDVQRMARNISRLIETGVETEVKRGRNALERVSADVQKAVGSTLPQLKQHLRSAGTKEKCLFIYLFVKFNSGDVPQNE